MKIKKVISVLLSLILFLTACSPENFKDKITGKEVRENTISIISEINNESINFIPYNGTNENRIYYKVNDREVAKVLFPRTKTSDSTYFDFDKAKINQIQDIDTVYSENNGRSIQFLHEDIIRDIEDFVNPTDFIFSNFEKPSYNYPYVLSHKSNILSSLKTLNIWDSKNILSGFTLYDRYYDTSEILKEAKRVADEFYKNNKTVASVEDKLILLSQNIMPLDDANPKMREVLYLKLKNFLKDENEFVEDNTLKAFIFGDEYKTIESAVNGLTNNLNRNVKNEKIINIIEKAQENFCKNEIFIPSIYRIMLRKALGLNGENFYTEEILNKMVNGSGIENNSSVEENVEETLFEDNKTPLGLLGNAKEEKETDQLKDLSNLSTEGEELIVAEELPKEETNDLDTLENSIEDESEMMLEESTESTLTEDGVEDTINGEISKEDNIDTPVTKTNGSGFDINDLLDTTIYSSLLVAENIYKNLQNKDSLIENFDELLEIINKSEYKKVKDLSNTVFSNILKDRKDERLDLIKSGLELKNIDSILGQERINILKSIYDNDWKFVEDFYNKYVNLWIQSRNLTIKSIIVKDGKLEKLNTSFDSLPEQSFRDLISMIFEKVSKFEGTEEYLRRIIKSEFPEKSQKEIYKEAEKEAFDGSTRVKEFEELNLNIVSHEFLKIKDEIETLYNTSFVHVDKEYKEYLDSLYKFIVVSKERIMLDNQPLTKIIELSTHKTRSQVEQKLEEIKK